MTTIYGMKMRKVYAEPGVYAMVGEIELEDEKGDAIFVAEQRYNGYEFTVSRQSMYDFLVGNNPDPADEFEEEYQDLESTKASVYAKVFEKLDKELDILGTAV